VVRDKPEVTMLKVQLFGKGEASYDGLALDGFPGQQCHRLLCYLLLNRHHPHPRERLAAVFWAEYPTATSRTYLRTCLWRLRQALSDSGAPADEYLLCVDDSLTFPNSGPYWLDVEAFEGVVNTCRSLPGDRLAPEQARDLESAAALYAGDLLEGTYDDWCLYDRERLRLLHLNLLCKLLAYHEGAGTYEQGLDYAQRILARDPTREKVHRQVMRLYWLMGNPVEALAQYRCCVQILHEELGIEPTAKTSALYEQMLHNRFDPSRWPVHRQNGLPERLARDEASRPAGEQLLDRLRRLEAVTAETGAELHEVRRLMEKALTPEVQDP
jgi:DNA-binding SARP family transcriptional activator